MPRYKLTVEYDGTGIAGWQKQPDRPTIQSMLEEAAARFNGMPTQVIGAGRTDSGVHAIAQVVHVDLNKALKPYNAMQALNFHLLSLTQQVIITHCEEVSDDFHARFSAIGRGYWYHIINRRSRLAIRLAPQSR